MKTINKHIILGYLTADAVQDANAQFSKCTVNIGTKHEYKDSNEQWQEEDEYQRVTFYGKAAEIVIKNWKQGDLVYVEGGVKTESWGEGENRRYSTVTVQRGDFKVMESKAYRERKRNSNS